MRTPAVFVLILSARLALAQSISIPPVVVNAYPTATEQLKYASRLHDELLQRRPGSIERKTTMMRAMAAWDVVTKKWPNDANAVGSACSAQAQLLLSEHFLPNVPQVCADKKLAPPFAFALQRYQGLALERAGRIDDARALYLTLVARTDFPAAGAFEQAAIYNRLSFVNERTGRYGEAAAAVRREALVSRSSKAVVGAVWLHAIEMDDKAGDVANAKSDVRQLDQLLQAAWSSTLSSEEITYLKTVESNLRRWQKKYGSS